MRVYQLYLESGPKHMKTMVHVPELLGCVVTGPTTEETLKRTPDEIRAYFRFLKRHGEQVDPDADVQTEVVAHFTEGIFLGQGDPTLIIGNDLEPLTQEDVEEYIKRAAWMRFDMIDIVDGLTEQQIEAKPDKGRPIRRILEHCYHAEYAYIRHFGKLPDVSGPGNTEELPLPVLLDRMAFVQEKEFERLRSITDAQLSEPIVHRNYDNTPRQYLRFMVSHAWDHLAEIKTRLGMVA
jgi:predicted RNase H-like HicB family nuclease